MLLFALGAAGGVILSVWVCGAAAHQLQQTDPPSVVLDELIAIPLCFVGWITWVWFREHELPAPLRLFDSSTWFVTLTLLGLFRVFDIVKPWPVFQLQALPGGWGITMDDVLAAVYVNLCWLGFLAIGRFTN
jgi:phosphatidylglycerophosphatase A